MKNHSPDRDHPDEQREADERARFLQYCAQDGLTQMHRADVSEGGVGIGARVSIAEAAAEAAATGQCTVVFMHDGAPPEPPTPSLQHVKEV